MNMNYEVDTYDSEHRDQVLKLQTHLWSPDMALNSQYLEWKYYRNPYLKSPLIYLVLSGERVVGMYGIYGSKWQAGEEGDSFIVPCSGDSVIAPEHRRLGLITELSKRAVSDLSESNFNYLFKLSASPVTYVNSLKMGWRSVGPIEMMYWMPLSYETWNYEKKRFFFSSADADHAFHYLDNYRVKGHSDLSPFVSVEKTPRSGEMAKLVNKAETLGRIQHVRDESYFTWRYQNPLSQYRFLYWKDAEMKGYLVLKTSVYTDQIKWIAIVDLEATTKKVLADLVTSALQLVRFGYVTIWTATLAETAKDVLKRAGFLVTGQPKSIRHYRPSILIKKLENGSDWTIAKRSLLEISNWNLRMLFSDGF